MVWLGAVNRLIQIGEPAVYALSAAASDEDPFVRHACPPPTLLDLPAR